MSKPMSKRAVGKEISIQHSNAPVGAEILGIDLSQELDDQIFGQIRDTFYRCSVVVFRDQELTSEQHIAFSRRFSQLEIHVMQDFLLPQHPEILVLSNILKDGKPIGLADAGRVSVWHTDMSYLKEPSAGSLLYAREVPHNDAGEPLGDTMFASTFAAYDALSASMKRKLAGLKAVHRMTKGYDNDKEAPVTRVRYTDDQRGFVSDQTHPIVRTHPVTGRKCIYISRLCVTGIVDMPDSESGPLLEELYTHCTRPEYIYRHKWRVGDLLMWDNCPLQHLAVHDYALPQRRLMHRTTLKGLIPF